MNLNGWQRLWIVAVLVLGIGIGYYTTKITPDLPKMIKLQWIKEASEVMAQGSLDNNNKPVSISALKLRKGLYNTYKTQDKVIAFLEKTAKSRPKDETEEDIFNELTFINTLYKEKLADPDKNNTLYFGSFMVWLAASMVLYLLGMLVGGVFKGFKK